MNALARAWHRAHPMPKRPTVEQRLAWHLEHQRRCGCRPIPPRLLRALIERAHRRHPVVAERHPPHQPAEA